MVSPFILFGSDHITVLMLTVMIPIILWGMARRSKRAAHGIAAGLAIVLLINHLIYFSYICIQNTVPWVHRFPMELCDWLTYFAIAALLTRKQFFYELTFFWGFAGTLQATVTPDIEFGFPNYRFIYFFITHSGILVAALFLTLTFKLRPYPKSLIRAFGWLQAYLFFGIIVNNFFGTNFGYLCYKPANPTLLDKLGPWPWYVVFMELITLLSFGIYYLPFFVYDSFKRRFNQELAS